MMQRHKFVYAVRVMYKNVRVLAHSCVLPSEPQDWQKKVVQICVNILWKILLLLIKISPESTVSFSTFIGTRRYSIVLANFLSWGR